MKPGDVISDEYTLIRRLGTGSFGEVWLARQDRLRREVALKFATSALLNEVVGGTQRFAQEAITHGGLSHRHIVPLLDARTHDGLPFLVMPHLKGGSLQLKVGHLSREDLIRTGIAVCEALAYAHAKGIVHRDIKPENLLLDEDGVISVADFGIAKTLSTMQAQPSRATVAGTEGFSAPEQFAGRTTDHRADIFALGTTLFHVATGKSPIDLITKRRADALLSLDASIRPVIERMTELEPNDRHPDASSAKLELQRILQPRDPNRSPATSVKKPGTTWTPPAKPRPAVQLGSTAPETHEPAKLFNSLAEPKRESSNTKSIMYILFFLSLPAIFLFAPPTNDEMRHNPPHQPPPEDKNSYEISKQSRYKMALVPAGKYTIGSIGEQPDERQRTATLTQPFWIGVAEVTRKTWSSAMGKDPSYPFALCGPDCPVQNITWCDALAFANALSLLDGFTPAYDNLESCERNPSKVSYNKKSTGYQLPTDTQWEVAAIKFHPNNGTGDGWHFANSGKSPHPICKKQTGVGTLCDMLGNVSEWTWDVYERSPGGSTFDPRGPATGPTRVVRGGSWSDLSDTLRIPNRNDYAPAHKSDSVGVRLARTAAEP